MAMIADMTIRHDDAIYYSVMIDCKGDENTLQMMIMIMVIIMILIIVRNHSDDDGDHSNITRLSLIDDIDGDDKEQDFISMIWISIDFSTYNRAVPQLISLLTTGQYHKDNHSILQKASAVILLDSDSDNSIVYGIFHCCFIM